MTKAAVKFSLLAICFAVALALLSPLAKADGILDPSTDPATLHIGSGAKTACAEGCAGDPNLIVPADPQHLDIYQNQGGSTSMTDVLLILAAANDTGSLAAKPLTGLNGLFGAVTYYNNYSPTSSQTGTGTVQSATGVYSHLKAAVTGTYYGDMTAAAPNDVYGFLGFGAQTTNSNNFVNWSNAVYANESTDFAPGSITGFGIYVYDLHVPLNSKGLVDIAFEAGLTAPPGSFAVAYGCSGGDSCRSNPNPYVTPFTESGLMPPPPPKTPVSEPTSLLLLGSGLLGMAGFWGKRKAEA